MRICLLAYKFYETETRLQEYARALTGRGDVVDVIALRRVGQPSHEVLDGVNVSRIQTRKVNEQGRISYLFRILRFLLYSAVVLTKKQLLHSYQLIHVLSAPDFLVFGALLPKLVGVPTILEIRDILPEFYASKFSVSQQSIAFRLLKLIEKCCITFSDHVIIANDLWYERIKSRHACGEKCTLIRDWPDPQFFFARPRDRVDSKFLITYPGTLNWHQGLDIAIKAFAKVKDKIPEAEFHIYGEGPSKPSLMILAKQLGLNGKVVFHELLPIEQIARVMADSDLAIIPKRAESLFGNEAVSSKIGEFMALGIPVIVSRTRVDTYYYDDTVVKFFDSGNDSDLANCILLLKQDHEVRNRLVLNAAKYVQEGDWHAKEYQYLHLMDSLTLQ